MMIPQNLLIIRWFLLSFRYVNTKDESVTNAIAMFLSPDSIFEMMMMESVVFRCPADMSEYQVNV